MKKGTKAALLVSAVLIASGGIMTGVGALAGGYDQLDKVNRHFRVGSVRFWNLPGFYGMNSLSWLGALDDDLLEARADEIEDSVERAADSFENFVENGSRNTLTYNGEKKESGQEVYSGDFELDIDYSKALTGLEVESGIHGVEIVEGSGEDIHVKGINCDKVQIYVKGNTLYVRDVEKKKLPGNSPIDENTRRIVLTVPSETEWKKAELSADMGYISMDVLRAADAELDADMGSVKIGASVAAELEIDADMGTVEVDEAQIGRLKMEASMGSITFSGIVKGDIEAESDMGSIKLSLGQKETDFNYRISADMGNVSINGNDYSGLSKTKEIQNGADQKMKLDSSMGNIEIFFE